MMITIFIEKYVNYCYNIEGKKLWKNFDFSPKGAYIKGQGTTDSR